MNRPLRIIFNVATVLSLVMWVANLAMWAMSYRDDGVSFGYWDGQPSGPLSGFSVRARDGDMILIWEFSADDGTVLAGGLSQVGLASVGAVVGLLPLVRVGNAMRHLRSLGRLPGRCPACGYDLRATPDRCPECGAAPPPPPAAAAPPAEPARRPAGGTMNG